MNLQPWHFVVVQQRERLRESGSLVPTRPYVAGTAFAIVVGYETAEPPMIFSPVLDLHVWLAKLSNFRLSRVPPLALLTHR